MNAPLAPASAAFALEVDQGQASVRGARPDNEDFCGIVVPVAPEIESKGVLAALSDGVSAEGGGGREASQYSVQGLLADYYATPDTWAIPYALDKVLNAANRWLVAQSLAKRNTRLLVTTLSAIVLRGGRYVTAHIGDSRIYRLRGDELARLTHDHVWEHPDLRHVLSRALGLDESLVVDYADGELEAGDVFVLVSDGVWSRLDDRRIKAIVHEAANASACAAALCSAATEAGGRDDATALVINVLAIAAGDIADSVAGSRALPLPPVLTKGERIDRFEVLDRLHASRVTRLYKVRDTLTGSTLVLKTLAPGREDESAALLTEEWMARRIHTPYFPEVLPLPRDERSALYYVMSHHEGETLQALADSRHNLFISQAVALGVQILKGLGALHRLNVLHRDIKPANLLLGADRTLRILDLGVALNSGGVHHGGGGVPGTPSYLAPELIAGAPASPQTDLYAVGVTLYYLLTHKFPYGEIEPFQHPRFGAPLPPTRYRTDLPGWLEAVLLKAVARDPERRFETAEEFLLALERGAQRPLEPARRLPLAERDPLRLWMAIALVSLLANLALAYLLIAGAAR
jgi:protein phosphatase